jgi:hypothetical protein
MSPQRKEEMTIDGYLRGSRRSHNQKRETNRDASRGPSMRRLGVVSTDKLLKSSCSDGLVVVHDEQRGVHERKKTVVVDNHSEGSEKGHRRSSQEKIDRELAEIKVQLEVMREFVQRNMEDQRYGWVLQRKRIKWIQLQRRLKYDTRVQLEEELRGVELQQRMCVEEEVYLCEPEQGSVLGESSDEDEDMRLDDGFMDPWKDENQLEELMFETTKEALKPYDFETNKWCMYTGFTGSNYVGQSLRTVTQVKEKMVGCGYEDCSDMRKERQSLDTVIKPRKEMITHVHMRNIEKDYSQVKKDVQLKDIQNISQKGNDKELVVIRERLSKLEKLIQEDNEDEYYGWVMKRKRVQWFALQQRQRLKSLVLRKDRELKKAELEQGMMRQKGIYSCERESEIFLWKTDEEGINPRIP